MAKYPIGGGFQRIAEQIASEIRRQRAVDPRVDTKRIIDVEIQKEVETIKKLLDETDNPVFADIYKDALASLPKLARDLKSRK